MDFCFYKKSIHPLADKKKLADELKGPIFYSHGKTNSCEVAVGYIGSNKVDVLDKKNR